jgi:hypothetical protein
MTSLLALALTIATAQASPPRPISDAEIARIATAPFNQREKMFHHDVLGINRGMIVVADYPCSDVCPVYTVRIIHYDHPAGPSCERAGGVSVDRRVPRGIAVHDERFCVPRVVANARR